MKRDEITRSMMLKLVAYNPETGIMTWRARTPDQFVEGKKSAIHQCRAFNSRLAGMPAFSSNHGNGYKSGKIFGITIFQHRIVFLLENGEWPELHVDHINGDRGDNRRKNLRLVTKSQNGKNAKLRRDNLSGVIGVSWLSREKKWRATICGRCLGFFGEFEEAVKVRKKAEIEEDFHPNHGRSKINSAVEVSDGSLQGTQRRGSADPTAPIPPQSDEAAE